MTSRPDYPLVLSPHFSPRPWGGRGLETVLGKTLPANETVGESWELSDHPNGKSTIQNGPLAGREFGELYQKFPLEMVGTTEIPERFPLLVKFIDAQGDLSIQVHPNDLQAQKLGDRGKTECWYIMDCEPETEIIFGIKPGITAEALRTGCTTGEVEGQVASFPIQPNNFLFVRAGTVHAIRGGTLICEIQQASDTTFRLWDWNREPKRELHIEESIEAIDWNSAAAEPIIVPPVGMLTEPQLLAENEFFSVVAVDVDEEESTLPGTGESGQIVVVLQGEGHIHQGYNNVEIHKGQTIYIPALIADEVLLQANQGSTLRLLVAESKELQTLQQQTP